MDRRGRERVQTVFEDESLTVQSDYELTRIDKIMARYGIQGVIDHLADVDAMFLDVTELPEDYQSVLEYTAAANEAFMKLGPKTRALFNHDVALWLDAAHDQEKRDAIIAKVDGEVSGVAESGKAEVSPEVVGGPESSSS